MAFYESELRGDFADLFRADRLAFLRLYLRGPCPKRVTGDARREFLAVTVVNRTALGLDRCVLCLLRDRFFGQPVGLDNLPIRHAKGQEQQQKRDDYKSERDSFFIFCAYRCCPHAFSLRLERKSQTLRMVFSCPAVFVSYEIFFF